VPAILNVSAYKFVPLDDAPALRERVYGQALAAGLKGTVLIASEGINLFLAGEAANLRNFLDALQSDPRLAGLPVKESWSEQMPFKRLLVKVKREIIRMNHPTIQPQAGRAPAVDARTLQRWLDQGHDDDGRPVVTLDTRNAFEVDYGTFEGAIDWRIGRFSEFPEAVQAHRQALEGKTVVSFCTGGIRCEKAAIYLREAGVQNVWQLEGGVLRYFEETGGAHWQGRCFVFDEREALDASLQPART
jgi:UPF0176 protein